MKDITERQQAILEYIRSHFADNNYWPSIRDIQTAFGFKSTNAVTGHLRALERKGSIARVPGQARAYRLGPAAESPAGKRAAAPVPFAPVRELPEERRANPFPNCRSTPKPPGYAATPNFSRSTCAATP